VSGLPVRGWVTDIAIGMLYVCDLFYGDAVRTMAVNAIPNDRVVALAGYRRENCVGLDSRSGSGSWLITAGCLGVAAATLGSVVTLGSGVLSSGGGVSIGGAVSGVVTLGSSAVTVGAGVVVGWVVSFGCAILLKMFASFSIALIVSFVTSWNGGGGGGSVKVFVSFVTSMIILSVCVSAGELHFVGNNSNVSDILSPPVYVIYTL
jgi:hypothetical protein